MIQLYTRMISWLFSVWHFKCLIDLLTTQHGRCFVCNCSARHSLKTPRKHLAIRKIRIEINLRLAGAFWNHRSGNCSLELKTKTISGKRKSMRLIHSAETSVVCCSVSACSVFVSLCVTVTNRDLHMAREQQCIQKSDTPSE